MPLDTTGAARTVVLANARYSQCRITRTFALRYGMPSDDFGRQAHTPAGQVKARYTSIRNDPFVISKVLRNPLCIPTGARMRFSEVRNVGVRKLLLKEEDGKKSEGFSPSSRPTIASTTS